MQVSPNNHTGLGQRSYGKPLAATPGGHSSDSAQFEAAAWEWAMSDTPEVRASEVERARDLIADKNYPPPAIVELIGALLARHLGDAAAET
jgi:hypothetical protein